MTEAHHALSPGVPAPEKEPHVGPGFKDYIRVFGALCVLTAMSFFVYATIGHGPGAVGIIMVLAVIKASLVATVFMHLVIDFRLLYGIIIPVLILCVMATFIFLPDQVLYYHNNPPEEASLPTSGAAAPHH